MKRIIPLCLAITLLLCGCMETHSHSSDPETGPLPVDMETSWDFSPPKEEKVQQIKKALSDLEGIDHTGHEEYAFPYVCGMRSYGCFNGYDILFRYYDSGRTNYEIGGIHFSSGFPFVLYAHREGVLYSLNEAYSNGWLSLNHLKILSLIHIYAFDSVDQALPLDGFTSELSQEIQTAYAAYTNNASYLEPINPDDRFNNMVCGLRWYGSYNGCSVLLDEEPKHDIDIYTGHSVKIGKEMFCFGTRSTLLAYRNGEIRELEDAYKAGWISDVDLAQVAEIHASRMWP